MIAKGDKTLRLNYELHKDSIVFDLGGYEGQWASDIFSKYQCTIYLFEPFKPYCENIRSRFSKNDNLKIFDFGLGLSDKILKLYSQDDASSVFKQSGVAHDIEIKKASDFIAKLNTPFINLMKINIEGGEYELLEELIDSGLIAKIKNVQVQFHDFVPNANKRMEQIQKSLRKTHTLSYQFEFVWENWVLQERVN
ncbi:MAG: FkbM family methyltransferase [Cyclobacteriaceae bacterium]